MGRDQSETGPFEWVNAWAESAQAGTAPVKAEAAVAAPAVASKPAAARVALLPDDQLMRDIAEIERVRDALAAIPVAVSFRQRTQALTLVPARTTDPVPVVVGGVLALVMLTVFGAAAAMSKFGR
jgi:hypothetical protein